MSTAYEIDFWSWTKEQEAALRAAAAARVNLAPAIDWDNLASEIADMGVSQEKELWSRFRGILLHLAKWQHQPEARSGSRRGSVRGNRAELRKLLDRNPGLKRIWMVELADAWPDAREQAADETGLPLATFPETCPYTVEQVMDPAFWPGMPQAG